MLTAGTKMENPATIEQRHAVMRSKGQGNNLHIKIEPRNSMDRNPSWKAVALVV
jgi:hypothetical protein